MPLEKIFVDLMLQQVFQENRSNNAFSNKTWKDGFSWDKSRCMVIAENDVWAKCIEKHPEVEAIRVKGCLHYEQLNRIFSESGSSGNYAFLNHRTAASKMDSPPSEDQFKQDQSRAKWSAPLDKILLDYVD
ncbi:hypothetical protein L3X38_006617 [Prunus dulcis]|uniref:Uncharacterized protein n=1 Tax=Prunus dulcis TaxID=3755 RepID=A0AAD4ZSX9_PRUDU|nr:hypothetical protein L3X38_006617 [Prunus dulcis]